MTVEVHPARTYDTCDSCSTNADIRISVGTDNARNVTKLCTDCVDQPGWQLVEKTSEPHPEHPTSSPPINPPLHQQR